MTHPLMFESDDPILARLREVALAFPGAQERVSHGRPNWFTKNQFAAYGGHVKGSHHDESLARALIFKPDADHRDLLLGDERFVVPGYHGPFGWLAIALDTWEPGWDEVADLVEESYRMTAHPKLVRELDARGGPHAGA